MTFNLLLGHDSGDFLGVRGSDHDAAGNDSGQRYRRIGLVGHQVPFAQIVDQIGQPVVPDNTRNTALVLFLVVFQAHAPNALPAALERAKFPGDLRREQIKPQ